MKKSKENVKLIDMTISELSAYKELQRRRVKDIYDAHSVESKLLQQIDQVLIAKRDYAAGISGVYQ